MAASVSTGRRKRPDIRFAGLAGQGQLSAIPGNSQSRPILLKNSTRIAWQLVRAEVDLADRLRIDDRNNAEGSSSPQTATSTVSFEFFNRIGHQRVLTTDRFGAAKQACGGADAGADASEPAARQAGLKGCRSSCHRWRRTRQHRGGSRSAISAKQRAVRRFGRAAGDGSLRWTAAVVHTVGPGDSLGRAARAVVHRVVARAASDLLQAAGPRFDAEFPGATVTTLRRRMNLAQRSTPRSPARRQDRAGIVADDSLDPQAPELK